EPPPTTDDLEGDEVDGKGKKKPKRVPGAGNRQAERNRRAQERKKRAAEVEVVGSRVITADELEDRPRAGKLRPKIKIKRGTEPRKGKIPVEMPITVRSLSEAMGRKSGELLFKLMAQSGGANLTINSTIDAATAELIALEYGCELEIKRPLDTEE